MERTNGEEESMINETIPETPNMDVKESSNHEGEPSLRRSKRKLVLEEKVTLNKKKVSMKVTKTNANERTIFFPALKSRSSPKALFGALRMLKTGQKRCLRSMGFGQMLEFNVDEIPSRLGYYVVDSFDDEALVIRVNGGSIQVTKELIHEMIGVPIGGIAWDSMEVTERDLPIKVEWRSQYKNNEISPSDLKRKIDESDVADWNFKLNFLMLFCNIIAGCKMRGKCDKNIIKYIREDIEFKSIDWCLYLLNSLKGCKKDWLGAQSQRYYAGPLTLLTLLYVDGTVCNDVKVTCKRPTMKYWYYEVIKRREDAEMKSGGFGLGGLRPPYDHYKYESDFDDEEEIRESGIYSSNPKTPKGYICKMSKLYEWIMKVKMNLQKTSNDALAKFGDNVEVVVWNKKIEILVESLNDGKGSTTQDIVGCIGTSYTVDVPRVGKGGVDHAGVRCIVAEDDGGKMDVVGEQKMHAIDLSKTIDGIYEGDNEKRGWIVAVEDSTPLVANYVTPQKTIQPTPLLGINGAPVSPFWDDPNIYKTMDDSVEKYIKSREQDNRVNELVGPSFSLGLTQEFNNEATEMVNTEENVEIMPMRHTRATERARGKRKTTASEYSRSPYVQRIVDIDAKISTEEMKVIKFITSHEGEASDIVFSSLVGHHTSILGMESLVGLNIVEDEVIDCWTAILNFEEARRSYNKPLRLFCNTKMMSRDMLAGAMGSECRVKMFSDNMAKVTNNDIELMTLATIDMVFFPFQVESHWYVICFNLRVPAVEIIDSCADDQKIIEKYKGIPKVLHTTFVDFLKMVDHKNWEKIRDVIPYRLEMKWQTIKSTVDSGIFAMRHMECYMGDNTSQWECGLEMDTRRQKARLKKLRERYIARILTCKHNVNKSVVVKLAENYLISKEK